MVGDPTLDLGIQAKTVNPREVGADLLSATAAVKQLYEPPLLILNIGTATTLSLVDKDGNFAGVAIAPGVALTMDALYQGAANLPQVAFTRPEKVIGTSTVPCIQSGMYWGYIGLVEGLIRNAQKEYAASHGGKALEVVATGGYAPLIETPLITHHEPDLIHKGLKVIYDLNRAAIPNVLTG